ncbi:prenyltransferase/squalene oxidase repeat-containing protein [Nocardia sp. NPDC051756]|uniref:prenyltransferase/squalene oxidase repeat-containing protein n=1 Tax=Nocardia sp. NPDC051756 TaxID=3154751 RepID=UPI0034245FBA
MIPGFDLALLDQIVDRSIELLVSTHSQTTSNGGGWYHRLDDPTPGPSATAVALETLVRCDAQSSLLGAGLQFLRSRQLVSTDPLCNGGWAVNTSFGHPLLEATAVVTRFLGYAKVQCLDSSPDLGQAVDWILANQDGSGGWGSFLGQPPRTWLTCLALQALHEASPFDPAINRGVDWLVRQRSRSAPAAWGESRLSEPTVVHTSYCLLMLRQLTSARTDRQHVEAVEHGFRWLTGHLNSTSIFDEASRVESYNITGNVDGRDVTWHGQVWHHGMPFALSALLRHPGGVPPVTAAVLKTVMDSQLPDGHWPNIDSASGRSIWDVYPFVLSVMDARTVPFHRPGSRIDWLSDDAVVVRQGTTKNTPLARLGWSSRRDQLVTLAKRHWATFLLIACVAGSLVLWRLGVIEPKDIALSLVLPLVLLLVQETRRLR